MMTLEFIALALALLSIGLFSGLMFSLIVLLQPVWNQQTASEYIADIQAFLKAAKGNPLVAAVLFTGILAPIVALIAGGGLETRASILILFSVIVFAVGALGVTVVFNLPTYTAIMELKVAEPATDWGTLRQRFYYLNLTRFVASTTAFVILIAAVILEP